MRGRIALYAGKKKPAPAPSANATTVELRDRDDAEPSDDDDRRDRQEVDELDERTMSRRETRSATMPPGIAHSSSPVAFAAATSDRSSGPPPASITV